MGRQRGETGGGRREWERQETGSSLEALKAKRSMTSTLTDERRKKRQPERGEKRQRECGGCAGCPWGARLRHFILQRLQSCSRRAGPSNLLLSGLCTDLFRARAKAARSVVSNAIPPLQLVHPIESLLPTRNCSWLFFRNTMLLSTARLRKSIRCKDCPVPRRLRAGSI